MLAINGIYEDGKINPLQDIPVNEKYIVRITFLKPLANADKENAESFLRAAESSLDFWDNEIDDEIWNNV